MRRQPLPSSSYAWVVHASTSDRRSHPLRSPLTKSTVANNILTRGECSGHARIRTRVGDNPSLRRVWQNLSLRCGYSYSFPAQTINSKKKKKRKKRKKREIEYKSRCLIHCCLHKWRKEEEFREINRFVDRMEEPQSAQSAQSGKFKIFVGFVLWILWKLLWNWGVGVGCFRKASSVCSPFGD